MVHRRFGLCAVASCFVSFTVTLILGLILFYSSSSQQNLRVQRLPDTAARLLPAADAGANNWEDNELKRCASAAEVR